MATDSAPARASTDAFDRHDATPRGSSRPYGTGTYRRRVLVRLDGTRAAGELEDDFHHFRVELEHDGAQVVRVVGTGLRSPWTVCLTAGDPLQALVGTALTTGPGALSHLDARRNCTHMFDLAGLVVTHAARGVDGDRLYDMAVGDPVGADGERSARLWRDGELVLDWHLHDRTLIGPPEWVQAPIWQGFIPWAATELEPELAEAAVALRRALDISRGRQADLDDIERGEELYDVMQRICHAYQPENVTLAIRHKGSARDFTDHEHLPLSDFDAREP